jgi:hypothetical protein
MNHKFISNWKNSTCCKIVLFYNIDQLFKVSMFETFCDCGLIKRNFFYFKNDENMFFPHDLTTDVCLIKKNSLTKTETGKTKQKNV